MAQLKNVEQAVVITSSLSNEQLKRAAKYFPQALVVSEKDEDGKKHPVFKVSIGAEPEVSKYGVVFATGEASEKASVTLTIPKMSKSKRVEYIKDNFGKVIVRLNAVETQFADADKEFSAEYKKLDDSIVIE